MTSDGSTTTTWIALHRLVFCSFVALNTDSTIWLSGLPDALFEPPPGMMQLFSGFPSTPLIIAYEALFWGSLGALAVGAWVRPASILFAVVGLLMVGFSDAMEKVHHRSLVFMAAPFLAWAGWDIRYALRPHATKVQSRELALRLLAVFIGAVYLSAAASKISGGWLALDTQAARAHVLARGYAGVHPGPLWEWARHGPASLWELSDWLTVIFQIAVFASAFSQRWFRPALLLVCGFHIAMYLFLRVAFWDYALVYAAFFAFPPSRAAADS